VDDRQRPSVPGALGYFPWEDTDATQPLKTGRKGPGDFEAGLTLDNFCKLRKGTGRCQGKKQLRNFDCRLCGKLWLR
jgi:hypothetical protein